jgi:PASTA domain
MSKDRSPWQDGRRAWERLNGWHQDGPSATPGHPDDGDGALKALADVGLVRHLLDQAELVAVRTARRHGKSWAEIATKLGVTRQSAWERWRDLDQTGDPQPSDSGSPPEDALPAESATAAERAGQVSSGAGSVPAEVVEREMRSRYSTVVPNVVGMSWDTARQLLHERGLVAVGPDPDGPPLAALGWPDGVVTDQGPEAGAKVPAGSSVTLWVERGGGSAGVREPRRPKPAPKTGREMRQEPSDEAVG